MQAERVDPKEILALIVKQEKDIVDILAAMEGEL
jgi:hypothetical protein